MKKMLLLSMLLLTVSCVTFAFPSTIFKKEFTCPVDGKKFTATLAGSGTSFDSGLDLQKLGPILSPWPVAQCPECGLIIFENEYTNEQKEKLNKFILSKEYKDVWKSHTTYFCYGLILEHMDPNDHFSVGEKFLQATWQTNDAEKYKSYSKKAIEHFSKIDNPMKDGKIPLDKIDDYKNWLISRYLMVELNRRNAQWDDAQSVLKELEKADLTKGPDWLSIALKHQKDLTSTKDSKNHSFGEFKFATRMFKNEDAAKNEDADKDEDEDENQDKEE